MKLQSWRSGNNPHNNGCLNAEHNGQTAVEWIQEYFRDENSKTDI